MKTLQGQKKPDTIKLPKRNPLVAPVMKKGVKRHRDRKREDRNEHKE